MPLLNAANKALSNLASVAINTALISDTDSTDDLGSAAIAWANLYVDTIRSGTGVPLQITPVAGQNLNITLSTTGDLAVNTNQLYVDTSAGNVGIGTTSPNRNIGGLTTMLDITGSASGGLIVHGGGGQEVSFISATGAFFDVAGHSTASNNFLAFRTASGASSYTVSEAMRITSAGNVGIGTTGPTAVLHLKAGTATASTAPLKFTSGTLNTTAEAGAMEFLTDTFYGTITTGAARKQFYIQDGTDVAVVDGGTGVSTLGDAGVLIGNGTGAVQVTSAGASGQVLTSNGAGVDPTFQAAAGGGTDMFSATLYTVSYLPDLDLGNTAVTGSGAVTALPASGAIKIATGATGSSTANFYMATAWQSVGYDQNMSVRLRIRQLDVSSNGTVYYYFISDNATAASATKYSGFRVSASAGTDTATAATKDGTTEQTTTVTANFGNTTGSEVYRNVMVIFTQNTNSKLYIGSTLVATHSTNFPPASDTTTTVFPWTVEATNSTDAEVSETKVANVVEQIAQ